MSTLRTTGTVRENFGFVFPRTSCGGVPVTSNKRKAIRSLISTARNSVVRQAIAKPLKRSIGTFFKLVKSKGATMVRVTTTSNLRLIPSRGQGPLVASAEKAKRLVATTLSLKIRRVVVKVNNDTAGSTKTKVVRTLNNGLLSGANDRVKRNKKSLIRLRTVSVSNLSSELQSIRFRITYSISGPLANPENTSTVFNPRGKTAPRVIRLLSRGLKRFTSIIRGALNGSFHRVRKTNTTKKVNKDLLTLLGTSLGGKVRVILRTMSFRGRMGSTSLIVAKRKGVSDRAVCKGAPVNITETTGGRKVPMVNLTNSLSSSDSVIRRRKVSTLFDVIPNIMALPRTLRGTTVCVREATEGVTTDLGVGKSLW